MPTTDQYGLPDPQIVSGMTGKEFLQAMIDGRLPRPPIAQTLSFRIVEVGDGFAAFEGDPGPHLLNPMGIVHGGWALTLIDTVTGLRRALLAAGKRQLNLDRDQGKFFVADQARHRPRAR
jgi:acyl-coenzyme A thioesterase PaaI-like protein